MGLAWYRQDKEAVVAALRRGERPDMATTISSRPLDELGAPHHRVGGFAALDAVGLARQRAGAEAGGGSGRGGGLRRGARVCVWGARPLSVAWRLLCGYASEKGQEAQVARELVEQALRLGGPRCIRLLLADALYADGPLLAWLKYGCGIDVLVPLPADRDLYADLAGLVATGRAPWTTHHYTVVLQGHKHLRTVTCAAAGDLTSWASFLAAAAGYGAQAPHPWAPPNQGPPGTGQEAEGPRAL